MKIAVSKNDFLFFTINFSFLFQCFKPEVFVIAIKLDFDNAFIYLFSVVTFRL